MDAEKEKRSFQSELDDAEEQYLLETLEMLEESYRKAAQPYIDRLVQIYNRRPMPVFMWKEQADALGIKPLDSGK